MARSCVTQTPKAVMPIRLSWYRNETTRAVYSVRAALGLQHPAAFDELQSTCQELYAVRGASSSQMCYVLPAQRQRPLAVFLVNNSGGFRTHNLLRIRLRLARCKCMNQSPCVDRFIGGDKIGEFWGRPSSYTEGTAFLGTPKEHLEVSGAFSVTE